MNNSFYFSIVIPAYNCEKTIQGTVASMTNQTFSNYEVIIINDGSTDGTEKKVNEYIGEHPNFSVFTIENNGPGNARNIGIDKAKGKYLFFMDADDALESHTLEQYAGLLEQGAFDLIIASYNMKVMDGDALVSERPVIVDERHYATNEEFLKNLYSLMNKQLMYVIWNKVYRTDIIRKHGIKFPNYSSCEDRLFNLAYYKHANSVYTTERILYQYSFDGKKSLTNKYFPNKFETFVEFYEQMQSLSTHDLAGVSALFLKGAMSCMIPLHSKGCPLNSREKMTYIKNILTHPQVRYATENSSVDTSSRKIMRFLFSSKSVLLNYAASNIMFLMNNLSPKFFEKLKGNF